MGDLQKSLISLIAGLFICCAGSSSRAAVWIEFVDMGVPTDGVQSMYGWRGIIARVHTDTGLITRLNFSSAGFIGSLAQRWVDPTGQADTDPSLYGAISANRSLGPIAADNSTLSEFNFDSHFLGDPSDYQTIEFADEYNLNGFHLPPTHLTSTPFVGYGSPFSYTPAPDIDPFLLGGGGICTAVLF